MADRSGIEWTDATWNPVTGCMKVSSGCDRCYAETFAERFRGVSGHYFENGFDVQLRPEKLHLPLSWRKPRKVFVNSMSDLFHKDVPDEYIEKVFAVMAATPWHTYQVLTKRHGRMRSLLGDSGFESAVIEHWDELTEGEFSDRVSGRNGWGWYPLRNVWLGVSVETQQWADVRVPALLETPACKRFVSAEPLLGHIDLSRWLADRTAVTHPEPDAPDGAVIDGMRRVGQEWIRCERLHWVIVGGESGPGARPMHPEWARSLRDQCRAAGVAFFFKQWGAWAPTGQVGIGNTDPCERLVGSPNERGFREVIRRVGTGRAGRVLDGRTWEETPTGGEHDAHEPDGVSLPGREVHAVVGDGGTPALPGRGDRDVGSGEDRIRAGRGRGGGLSGRPGRGYRPRGVRPAWCHVPRCGWLWPR
jgi:protein gp37